MRDQDGGKFHKKLARAGIFDGHIFHRIVKNFMMQGGDPLSKDPSKGKIVGRAVQDTDQGGGNDHCDRAAFIRWRGTPDPDSAG